MDGKKSPQVPFLFVFFLYYKHGPNTYNKPPDFVIAHKKQICIHVQAYVSSLQSAVYALLARVEYNALDLYFSMLCVVVERDRTGRDNVSFQLVYRKIYFMLPMHLRRFGWGAELLPLDSIKCDQTGF